MRGCSKMDIEQEATNTSSDIQKQDGANGIRIKRLWQFLSHLSCQNSVSLLRTLQCGHACLMRFTMLNK